MLNVLIEAWNLWKTKWKDLYGAKYFMQEYFKKHGINLVRWSFHHYDKEKKCFTMYDIVESSGAYKQIHKDFYPDIIWNRKNTWTTYKYDLFKKYIITPSEKIAHIGNDKYENYLFLRKYQPKTFLLSSFFKNTLSQKEINNPIIIKPLRANWGKGISLADKKTLLEQRQTYIWLEELFIVQEFKDFSKWYPWLTKGNHDIRCMFAGKNIIEMTIRTPKSWDFRSNIWSWGTQTYISSKRLPASLSSLIKKIYKELNISDTNIFSMDFAYCKKERKRYLLEINTSPWTWYYQKNKKYLKNICQWLVDFFLSFT